MFDSLLFSYRDRLSVFPFPFPRCLRGHGPFSIVSETSDGFSDHFQIRFPWTSPARSRRVEACNARARNELLAPFNFNQFSFWKTDRSLDGYRWNSLFTGKKISFRTCILILNDTFYFDNTRVARLLRRSKLLI